MGEITGIVLAGGKSSRMGTDKSRLLYKGKSFLDISIENLKSVATQILVISNHGPMEGLNVHADLYEDIGPLGGIYTGLSFSNNETTIVLACDMPLLTPLVLKEMVLNRSKVQEGLVPYVHDRPQLLCSVFQQSIHQKLKYSINSGTRKVTEFVEGLEIKKWRVPEEYIPYFRNINTEEDYQELIST